MASSSERTAGARHEQWSNEAARHRVEDIWIGNMTSKRRRQVCDHWEWDIVDGRSRCDKRLYLNSSSNYVLTLPCGLYAIISKRYGRYVSYADPNDNILHSLTDALAKRFDDYLLEITGHELHKLCTN